MKPDRLPAVSALLVNLALWGCATQAPDANVPSDLRSPKNRAIGMSVTPDERSVYSLYGIELGENRRSVSEKYELVACREGVNFLRCAVSLDTHGVDGIVPDDRTTVFITFRDLRVYSMTVPVFPTSRDRIRDALVKKYGPPALADSERFVWRNDKGSILMELNPMQGHPSVVTYSVTAGGHSAVLE